MSRPRYPVYVISKGRADKCHTARIFARDGLPFRLVVEPQEADAYCEAGFAKQVTVLPFSNLGQGSTPARNWCWNHSVEHGARRHWIFDDNILSVRRLHDGRRIPIDAGLALSWMERFVDRYTNIGVAGPRYFNLTAPHTMRKPFLLNQHVYSALLIWNDMPYRWRLRYNEDTDLCLQVLSNGLCTVNFAAFLIDKSTTMTMKGGNTDQLYQGNGRLVMARALQEMWPEHVEVKWRYGRPQHVIKHAWRQFTTPLKRRPDIDFDALPEPDPMRLRAVKDVKSPALRELLERESG